MTPKELRDIDVTLRAAVSTIREARKLLYSAAGALSKPTYLTVLEAQRDHVVAIPVDQVNAITRRAEMGAEIVAYGDMAEALAQRVSRTRGAIMKSRAFRQVQPAPTAAAAKETAK